jgi:hypothetical protein
MTNRTKILLALVSMGLAGGICLGLFVNPLYFVSPVIGIAWWVWFLNEDRIRKWLDS